MRGGMLVWAVLVDAGSVLPGIGFQWRPLIVGRLERDYHAIQCVMGP
eukprot:SAG31_NODE_43616_length_266_cov_0.844311_1_plen_46_part_01